MYYTPMEKLNPALKFKLRMFEFRVKKELKKKTEMEFEKIESAS